MTLRFSYQRTLYNDRDGNPRHGWLITDHDKDPFNRTIGFIDIGYRSPFQAMRDEGYGEHVKYSDDSAPTRMTVNEYNDYRKMGTPWF